MPREENEQTLCAVRTTPGGLQAFENANLNNDVIVFVRSSLQTRIYLRELTKVGNKYSKSNSKKLWVFTQGLEAVPFANAFRLFPEITFYRIHLVCKYGIFCCNISTHECQLKKKKTGVCSSLTPN